MTYRGAIRREDDPVGGATGSPTEFGPHVIPRTGAPPIRLVGVRKFHVTRGAGPAAVFISLWSMRSPGYVLAHSLPDIAPAASAAQRAASLDQASDALTTYCESLSCGPIALAGGQFLEAALQATVVNARIAAFRILAGQAMATWYEVDATFSASSSMRTP